jgi:hypothetical protein
VRAKTGAVRLWDGGCTCSCSQATLYCSCSCESLAGCQAGWCTAGVMGEGGGLGLWGFGWVGWCTCGAATCSLCSNQVFVRASLPGWLVHNWSEGGGWACEAVAGVADACASQQQQQQRQPPATTCSQATLYCRVRSGAQLEWGVMVEGW